MSALLAGESLTPEVGEDVIYIHALPGGYSFARRIPAKVVRITKTGRVTIDMVDGTRRTVSLWSIERLATRTPDGSSRTKGEG